MCLVSPGLSARRLVRGTEHLTSAALTLDMPFGTVVVSSLGLALLLALFAWALSSPGLVVFVETAEELAASNEPKSPGESTDEPAAINKHKTN